MENKINNIKSNIYYCLHALGTHPLYFVTPVVLRGINIIYTNTLADRNTINSVSCLHKKTFYLPLLV
jgi:hypothetical protein